jgi:hypothetical protein
MSATSSLSNEEQRLNIRQRRVVRILLETRGWGIGVGPWTSQRGLQMVSPHDPELSECLRSWTRDALAMQCLRTYLVREGAARDVLSREEVVSRIDWLVRRGWLTCYRHEAAVHHIGGLARRLPVAPPAPAMARPPRLSSVRPPAAALAWNSPPPAGDPALPIHAYEVILLDEDESPLPGIEVALDVPGFSGTVVTSGSGRARVESPSGGKGKASLTSLDTLVPVLHDRAERPPRYTPLPTDENARIRRPGQLLIPFSVPAGTPQRVIVLSRVRVGHHAPPDGWGELALSEAPAGSLDNGDATIVRLVSDACGTSAAVRGSHPEPPPEPDAWSIPLSWPADPLWRAPDIYLVQPGDWIGKIAEKYLGDADRWPEIWALNEDQLGDRSFNLVYPGDELRMPPEAVPPGINLVIPPPMETPPVFPPPPPEWGYFDVDGLLNGLGQNNYDDVLGVLLGLPVTPPPALPPPPSDLGVEDALVAAAIAELAFGGVADGPPPPSADGPEPVSPES